MTLSMRGVLWALCVWLAGCGSPTGVRVAVAAEDGVRAATGRVRVIVRGASGPGVAFGAPVLDQTVRPGQGGDRDFPFDMALAPLSNDATRIFEVTATAENEGGEFIAQARVIGGYLRGSERRLELLLEDSCRSLRCGEGQTCRAGACVDAREERLLVDAGTSPDASASGDGSVPGGVPGNDICAAATPLMGASGTIQTEPFDLATRQALGCVQGADLFFAVTVVQRTIFYADTFGSDFDTAISIRRGCGETDVPSTCGNDSCGTTNEQVVEVIEPGTHIVAVHAVSPGAVGRAQLHWSTITATTTGTVTELPGSGVVSARPPRNSGLELGCVAPEAGEDMFHFTMCPGMGRSIRVVTCAASGSQLFFVRGGDTLGSCAPSGSTCITGQSNYRSLETTEIVEGAGLFALVMRKPGWSPDILISLSVSGF